MYGAILRASRSLTEEMGYGHPHYLGEVAS